MNEIETKFYTGFITASEDRNNNMCCEHSIKSQVVIGIYKVDFLVDDEFVIEIDGYEYHKTKEQREHDYKRERYLMRNGMTVIRFTGTEVYLDCYECGLEALRLVDGIVTKRDYEQVVACMNYHDLMVERGEKKNAKQNTIRRPVKQPQGQPAKARRV